MALTIVQLRDRIADQIASELTPFGWGESTFPPELIWMGTREQRHLAYSVAVASTIASPTDRQRNPSGVRRTEAMSNVVVRWGYAMAAEGSVEDYEAALAQEPVILAAVMATPTNPGLSLRLERASRGTMSGDETYFLGVIELVCHHQLSLA